MKEKNMVPLIFHAYSIYQISNRSWPYVKGYIQIDMQTDAWTSPNQYGPPKFFEVGGLKKLGA